MTNLSPGSTATMEETEQDGHTRWIVKWTETDRDGEPKPCVATYSDRDTAALVRDVLRAGLLGALDGAQIADPPAPAVRPVRVRSTPHRTPVGAAHPWRR